MNGKYVSPKGCNVMFVPNDCCFLRFSPADSDHSVDGYTTTRNEGLIIHMNKSNHVIAIELTGSKKPCQDGQQA
jgi:hypothetical protein